MSVHQITTLMDYLEGHPELALGRISRSKEGRSLAKRLWQQCAEILNSISSDCSQKTGEQWRIFYNEYKYRLIRKIKKEKQSRAATGGGPSSISKLTALEERLYTILGQDIGEPLPGVRHNPLITQIASDGASTSLEVENVVIEETENDLGTFQMDLDQSGSLIWNQPEGSQMIHNEQSDPLGSPVAGASQATLSSEGGVSRPTAPRRRQRRRQQIDEPEDSMRRATESLEAMEHQSAQATLRHAQATLQQAQATNRLAAAIEVLSERISITIKLEQSPPKVCQKRRRSIN